MKKVLVIVLSFLLAVQANYAHANEPRCNDLNQLQPKVQEIQDFATSIPSLQEGEYNLILNKLSADTDAIATQVLGCDEYTDKIIAQMYGVIAKLNVNADKYQNSHNA